MTSNSQTVTMAATATVAVNVGTSVTLYHPPLMPTFAYSSWTA